MTAPPGIPNTVFVVTTLSGERYPLYQEPLEGMGNWAKGLNVTVVEYTFKAMIHRPPKPKPRLASK